MSILDETMPLVFMYDARAPHIDLVARTPHGHLCWSHDVGLTEIDCNIITHYMQGADRTLVVGSKEGWVPSPDWMAGPQLRGLYASIHRERMN